MSSKLGKFFKQRPSILIYAREVTIKLISDRRIKRALDISFKKKPLPEEVQLKLNPLEVRKLLAFSDTIL